MAFVVNLKYAEGSAIQGRSSKICKIKFREFEQCSKVVNGVSSIYFGERFEWPMARRLDNDDILQLSLCSYSKFFAHKCLGVLNISMQDVVINGFTSFRESMLDSNNGVVGIMLSFDVCYDCSDNGNQDMNQMNFNYPVTRIGKKKHRRDSSSSESEDLSLTGRPGHEMDDEFADMDSDGGMSMLSDGVKRKVEITPVLDPTMRKRCHFQVVVQIYEARELAGANPNPKLIVSVGEQKGKETVIKDSSNNPYFNNYFTFDLHMTKEEMMDQVILFRVLNMGNVFLTRHMPWSGNLIGEFRIDVRSVYLNDGYFQKWAMLVNPKLVVDGAKGYIKCDLGVISKGQRMRAPPVDIKANDMNYEANLLLPIDINFQGKKRELVEMAVRIYQAEDLPKMNTNLVAQIKDTILRDHKPSADPFVQVSFAGHTARIDTCKNTYHPEWNQEIVITEMFPSLCNRIRIEVFDWDLIYNECIATHFIDLDKIMLDDDDNPPTFGPSWVNLYGMPRQYTSENMFHPKEDLNRGLGEGAAYRGRLLMAIKSVVREDQWGYKIGARKGVCQSASDNIGGKLEHYLLFGAIFEAGGIDKELGDLQKPIQFELSIGTAGNIVDGKWFDDGQMYGTNPVKDKLKSQSLTAPDVFPIINDPKSDLYYHMPYDDNKPVLYVRGVFEDHRPRMCVPNIVEKIASTFKLDLDSSYEMYQRKKRGAHIHLKQTMRKLLVMIEENKGALRSCRGTAGKTQLDKDYQKDCRIQLEKIIVKIGAALKDCTMDTLLDRLRECRSIQRKLFSMMNCPQHGLPDIFVWMLIEKKRVAYARIPARKVYYSAISEEIGVDCGKLIDIFLKKPGRKGTGKTEWKMQCHLQMILWLGFAKDKRYIRPNIPAGCEMENFGVPTLPLQLCYFSKSHFQFRCHIFMARGVIAADDSGLSDVFARITLNNRVLETAVVEQTLAPIWDQLLYIECMEFCYDSKTIIDKPPTVIVEIYDKDIEEEGYFSKTEETSASVDFLGRCFAKPHVFELTDGYHLPKLEWWDMYRGQCKAGEILACFELIAVEKLSETKYELPAKVPKLTTLYEQCHSMISFLPSVKDEVDNETNASEQLSHYQNQEDEFVSILYKFSEPLHIPKHITPELEIYCIEVLFWGIREVKRTKIMNVTNFKINSIFGSNRIEQENVEEEKFNSNFYLKRQNVRLPIDERYWPPIIFDCEYKGNHFGSHVIVNPTIEYYIEDEVEAKEGSKIENIVENNVQSMIPPVDIVNKGKRGPASVISRISNHLNKNLASKPPEVTANLQNKTKISKSKNGGSLKAASIGKVDSNFSFEEPGEVLKYKPRPMVAKDKLEGIDWWSRYFATVDDIANEVTVLTSDESDESDSEYDALEDIKLEVESDVEENMVDIPEAPPSKKKKKKRKMTKEEKRRRKAKKKRARQNRKIPFLPDPSKDYEKEGNDDLIITGQDVEDTSWIERIEMFPMELEKVKEFGGFLHFVKNFPILRGVQEDDEEVEESRIAGVFKGNLMIYKSDAGLSNDQFNDESNDEMEQVDIKTLRLYKQNPSIFKYLSSPSIPLLVRIYCIRAIGLHQADLLSGKANPYLVVKIGDNSKQNREEHIIRELNPVFGRMFELDAMLPKQTKLHVQVWNWDRIPMHDSLIGETTIDLENRFFSLHDAQRGIPNTYDCCGYNKWRNPKLPTEILEEKLSEIGLPPPIYETILCKVTVAGMEFYADVEIRDDAGEVKSSNEPLALEVLQRFHEIPGGVPLVPEHTELRSLYTPDKPNVEQGRIEMWVEMSRKDMGFLPPAIDITPRKPVSYELRVIIWNTDDVLLVDSGFISGEKSSDIFVKAWIKGVGVDDLSTDVHYQSLTGEGNFNWRFIFKFDYIKAENKIIYSIKDNKYDMDESIKKVPARIHFQVWDANLVGSNEFIGTLEFDLTRIPRSAKSAKTCGRHQVMPEYNAPTFSIFKNKRVRGWWPFMAEAEDDPSEKDLTGKLEAEIILLLADEAENDPAGLGREDPQKLDSPNRPMTSFLSFLNPLKALRYLFCNVLLKILIKVTIILALVAIIGFFIYATPGYMSKKMLGA